MKLGGYGVMNKVHHELKMKEKFHFDLKFLKRFLKLSGWMFPNFLCIQTLLCAFLLCLGLLEQVVIYNIGNIPSKYYKVFGENDQAGFRSLTLTALGFILAEAFIKSTSMFTASLLYLRWRELITKKTHHLYFKDYLYFVVNTLMKVENPDQRITQDVDRLCDVFSQIFAPIIISPFTIGYYIYKCAQATGYLGPVGVIVFFVVGTIINKILMSPVVNLVFLRERREGDFRFKHMQMRVNAESAAFFQAGELELKKTNRFLGQLLSTQKKLFIRQYPLNFSINAIDYLGSILSYLLLALPIFNGSFDDLSPADLSSIISKNAFVIIYLISSFTKLIDLSVKVTELAGTAHRIGELVELLGKANAEQHSKYEPWESSDTGNINSSQDNNAVFDNIQESCVAFAAERLTYGAPGSHDLLCSSLSFHLEHGTNVLVTGDSGCGKSSLLRVIRGIWPSLSGCILKKTSFHHSQVMFLPQKPYFTNGSLRQQVLFPEDEYTSSKVSFDDTSITKYLEEVALDKLIVRTNGLDAYMDWNWYDELSPGEMQRLSFVRLFYHQPKFAILDESTSQIGLELEKKLYTMCTTLGITVMSVGHRKSLHRFHDLELCLDGKGGWNLGPLSHVLVD